MRDTYIEKLQAYPSGNEPKIGKLQAYVYDANSFSRVYNKAAIDYLFITFHQVTILEKEQSFCC